MNTKDALVERINAAIHNGASNHELLRACLEEIERLTQANTKLRETLDKAKVPVTRIFDLAEDDSEIENTADWLIDLLDSVLQPPIYDSGHRELLEVCRSLVEFQAYYEAHAHQPFPGNEFYSDKAMVIVNQAKAAIAKAEPVDEKARPR